MNILCVEFVIQENALMMKLIEEKEYPLFTILFKFQYCRFMKYMLLF